MTLPKKEVVEEIEYSNNQTIYLTELKMTMVIRKKKTKKLTEKIKKLK